MKRILLLFIFFCIAYFTKAQINTEIRYQNGYFKHSTGTYVEPHFKTYPNNTNHDNFSTKDNLNIFTGKKGYRARDYSIDAFNYGKNHVFHEGPRGGQYYYNE